MRLRAAVVAALALAPLTARAQDMTPRAYLITPVRSNAVTGTNIFIDDELLLDGTVVGINTLGGAGKAQGMFFSLPPLQLRDEVSQYAPTTIWASPGPAC